MTKTNRQASSVLLVAGLLLGFAYSSFQVARGRRLNARWRAAVEAFVLDDRATFAQARVEALALGLDARRAALLTALRTDPCSDRDRNVLAEALGERIDEPIRTLGLLGLVDCHLQDQRPQEALELLTEWMNPPHQVPEATVRTRLRTATEEFFAMKARARAESDARLAEAAARREEEFQRAEAARRAGAERSLDSALDSLETEFSKACDEADRGYLYGGDARLTLIERLKERFTGEVRFRLDSAVTGLRTAASAASTVKQAESYIADASRYSRGSPDIGRWVSQRDVAREQVGRSIAFAREQFSVAKDLMRRSPINARPPPSVQVTEWEPE